MYHLKSNILNKYNLLEYQNEDDIKTCFIFGVYDNNDFMNIYYFKGKKIIIFGGSDIPNIKLIHNYKKLNYVSISNDIYVRLKKFNVNTINVYFNLVNPDIFYKLDFYGNSIYIYDGIRKKDDNEKIYNLKLVEHIKKIITLF